MILSSANAVNSRRLFHSSTWNECYTNERQSRDSNRSATNAGSMSGTPKKEHKHKEFGQKPQGTPNPANSLRLGPLFPSKYRKKAYVKNFERGGGCGGPKILCAESLGALFLHLTMTTILTTPTPHISKKYAPKRCHKMRGRMA